MMSARPLEADGIGTHRKRRHGYLGNISPVEYDDQAIGSFESVH